MIETKDLRPGFIRKYVAVIVLVGIVNSLGVSISRADYLQFNNVEAADTVVITYAGVNNGYPLDVYDGQYSISVSPNSSFHPADGYNTFCVDLKDEVGNGQQYAVNVRSTSDGLTNGAEIAYLYNRYGINTINGGGSYTVGASTGVSGNDLAAGLQLAIWDELVNNGTTTGALTYSGESTVVDNLVAYFLTDAAANSAGAVAGWADSNGSAAALDSPPLVLGQGFVIPATVPLSTPEPSSVILFGLGALGLFAKARRCPRLA